MTNYTLNVPQSFSEEDLLVLLKQLSPTQLGSLLNRLILSSHETDPQVTLTKVSRLMDPIVAGLISIGAVARPEPSPPKPLNLVIESVPSQPTISERQGLDAPSDYATWSPETDPSFRPVVSGS
jgi:hypothetical protein